MSVTALRRLIEPRWWNNKAEPARRRAAESRLAILAAARNNHGAGPSMVPRKCLDLAAQEHSPAITVDLIRQLHRHAFGHIYEWAGTFRTHQLGYPLGVSDFWQITEHVRNLCDDLQSRLERLPLPESPERREESIRLVAWFQHRYVQIHPFADFNGRTARMLSALLSLQLGLPAAEVDADEPGEGRKEYVASMQAADGGNLHHLESLLTRAIDQAAGGEQSEDMKPTGLNP